MAIHTRSHRIIEFAKAATLDLASIDNATASTWGVRQADLYTAFLQEVIYNIANHPDVGRVPVQFPALRTYIHSN